MALVLLDTQVYAYEEKGQLIHVGRIICKDKDFTLNNYDLIDIKLNSESQKIFNRVLINSRHAKNLSIEGIDNEFPSLSYIINGKNGDYRLIIDNDNFYYIITNFKINIENLKGKYSDLSRDIDQIRYSLDDASYQASWNEGNYKCGAYLQDNPLLEIINIYDLPIKDISNSDPEIYNTPITRLNNQVFKDIANKYYYNVRDKSAINGYRYGSNIIFTNNNLNFYLYEEFSTTTEPIIVLSENEFYTQSLFYNNIDILKTLEKISSLIHEIDIENNKSLSIIKRNYRLSNSIVSNWKDDEDIWELIFNNTSNYTELNNLMSNLGSFQKQNDYYNYILDSQKEISIFYFIIQRRLDILNRKIENFEKRIEILMETQSNYDSLSLGILSSLKTEESISSQIDAIWISIILFLLGGLTHLIIANEKQKRILKNLMIDINEIAKTSESYKEAIIKKGLEIINNKQNPKNFRNSINKTLKYYKDILKINQNYWPDEIYKTLNSDRDPYSKVEILEKSIKLKPGYKIKQVDETLYIKKMDYITVQIFNPPIIKLEPYIPMVHKLISVINVINNQSDNSGINYVNIKELDFYLKNIMKNLIKVRKVHKTYLENHEEYSKLKSIYNRGIKI